MEFLIFDFTPGSEKSWAVQDVQAFLNLATPKKLRLFGYTDDGNCHMTGSCKKLPRVAFALDSLMRNIFGFQESLQGNSGHAYQVVLRAWANQV